MHYNKFQNNSPHPHSTFHKSKGSLQAKDHASTPLCKLLALAWDALFAYFRLPNNLNLTNLNSISSTIYKLTASYTQIKALELKSRELLLKESSHKSKNPTPLPPQNPTNQLSPETLHHIEQQLKLL